MPTTYTATAYDPYGQIAEIRTFEIAEHGAQWLAQYLTAMAEEGFDASATLSVSETE